MTMFIRFKKPIFPRLYYFHRAFHKFFNSSLFRLLNFLLSYFFLLHRSINKGLIRHKHAMHYLCKFPAQRHSRFFKTIFFIKLHPIPEILLLTLCGVISGCDAWSDIEELGQSKLEFLRNYRPYPNGIPSDDTLRRFFRAIDPKSFSEKFREWVKSLGEIREQVTALDGKTS